MRVRARVLFRFSTQKRSKLTILHSKPAVFQFGFLSVSDDVDRQMSSSCMRQSTKKQTTKICRQRARSKLARLDCADFRSVRRMQAARPLAAIKRSPPFAAKSERSTATRFATIETNRLHSDYPAASTLKTFFGFQFIRLQAAFRSHNSICPTTTFSCRPICLERR